jgi:hypothetical protein
MSSDTVPPEDPSASRRFAVLVYASFFAFVVFLTASYLFAEPIMDWMEAVVRKFLM